MRVLLKRLVLFVVLILWMLLLSFSPLTPSLTPTVVAQSPDWSYVSPDLDSDGLPDTVEKAGWCNAVGCFTTDPLDPDSDNDGLTDGEEKLFDANPLNDASPGIYVVYDEQLKTKEYYPWQPYGHKFIARG